MKKFLLSTTALFILAGSTFAVSTPSAMAATKKPKVRPMASEIPPPTCPPNDPNGCGIFG